MEKSQEYKNPHKNAQNYHHSDIYKMYIENGGKLDYSRYSNVIEQFNLLIFDKIIRNGFELKLPYGLGHLAVSAKRMTPEVRNGRLVPTEAAVDWGKTRALWNEIFEGMEWSEIVKQENKPFVYFENDHTNGYTMRIKWNRLFSKIKNAGFYGFSATKGGLRNGFYYGKRGLARWLKDDPDSSGNIYTQKYYGI